MSGRQRSVAADEAIVAATVALLGEVGYRGLTMSAVIERAGVSSATLYRRWPTKQALVAQALQCTTAGPMPPPAASLAGDLDAVARHVARAVTRRDDLWLRLWAEVGYDDDLRAMNLALVEPRLAHVHAVLERAVARGELHEAPSADVVLSLVTGPILHRALTLDEKVTPAFLRAVVDSVAAWTTTSCAGEVSTTSR